MAEQITELHNALHLPASGIQPNIPLHMQPAMLNTMNSYLDGIYRNFLIKSVYKHGYLINVMVLI